MKLKTIHDPVHVEGGTTQKFGLEFNSKIVHMLSNTLYSNKILAIMRELSTNAYDSHIEAKNDEPFEVHLPTQDNLIFYIRDYGTGMSPEKMKDVYSVYGKSDKTNSNQYIGCLGLGSKSPFSYHTKTFTVESFYNGTKYTYVCYLDDTGMPAYTEMDSVDTLEKNGLKVSIKVEKQDIFNFSGNIGVYTYFKIKPKLTGNSVSIPTVVYSEQNDLYGIRSYGSAQVIMGNIAYPVSLPNPTEEESKFLKSPIDLFFDIGQLDINIGREALSYDNLTINRIKFRLQIILKKFKEEINKILDESPSLFDARLQLVQLSHSKLQFINEEELKWKGEKIWKSKHRGIDMPESTVYSPNRKKGKPYIKITFHKGIKFFRFNLKSGNIVRIQSYIDNNHNIYAIEVNDNNIEKLRDAFGFLDSHIQNTSDIPYNPVRAPRAKRGTSTVVMKWNNYFHRKTYCWKSIEKDLKEGGYYVPWKNYEAVIPNGNSTVSRIIGYCDKLKLNIGEVYGIKEKHLSKLGPEWVNLYTYVQEYVNRLDKKKIIEEAKKQEIYYKIQNDYYSSFLLELKDILPELTEVVSYSKIPEEISTKVELIKLFDKIDLKVDHEKIVKPILKKYPLLHVLSPDEYIHRKVIKDEVIKIIKEKVCSSQN